MSAADKQAAAKALLSLYGKAGMTAPGSLLGAAQGRSADEIEAEERALAVFDRLEGA